MNARPSRLLAGLVAAGVLVAFDSCLASNTHPNKGHMRRGPSAIDYGTSYSVRGPAWMDQPAGGNGGEEFDDRPDIPYKATVTAIVLRHGMEVDSMRFIWNGRVGGQQHGGNGGKEADVALASGEYITGLMGSCSSTINQITILTNHGQYGPFGDSSGNASFVFEARKGYCIVGVHGRAGMLIDRIGPIYQRIPPLSSGH